MTVKTRTTYRSFVAPAHAPIGNHFGILPNSRFYGPQGHRGVDWRSAGNPTTYAVGGGTVVKIQWSSGLGNCVVIKVSHPTRPYVGYAHLSRVDVKVGQKVKNGQVIGRAGATGSLADGVHNHCTWSSSIDGLFYGQVYNLLDLIGTADKTTGTKEIVWKFIMPEAGVLNQIIKELRRLHVVNQTGTIDKAHFIQGVEKVLRDHIGFPGVVNGEATWHTTESIQKFGVKYAHYLKADVDAVLGANSWNQFLAGLKKI